MTNVTVHVRGNIDDNEIKRIQHLVNKHGSLPNRVTLVAKGERFDANYISLGANIVAAIASLLYIFLETRNLLRKQSDKDEGRDSRQRIQDELSVSTQESVEVIQVSSSRNSIAVTLYEPSQDRTISVKYSRVGNNDILDIS